MSKEEIEAKARKMFPIGTKFFPAHLLDSYKLITKDYCINSNNNFKWEGDCLYIYTDENDDCAHRNNSKYGNTSLYRVVYHSVKKVFAKVLSIKQKNYELWD